MRKTATWASVCLLISTVVVTGTIGASAAPSRSAAPTAARITGAKNFTVFTRHFRAEFVDNPPKGNSPGDLIVTTADDFDQLRGGHRVGNSGAFCVNDFGSLVCKLHFEVTGKGSIIADGAGGPTSPDFLAVLGGTGVFRNVRGQVARTFLPNSIRFELQLLP